MPLAHGRRAPVAIHQDYFADETVDHASRYSIQIAAAAGTPLLDCVGIAHSLTDPETIDPTAAVANCTPSSQPSPRKLDSALSSPHAIPPCCGDLMLRFGTCPAQVVLKVRLTPTRKLIHLSQQGRRLPANGYCGLLSAGPCPLWFSVSARATRQNTIGSYQ